MQLLNQKSDNDHRDNDWMTIVWAVNGEVVSKSVFPLSNDKGSTVLQSGDLIPRFETSVSCHDEDLVTATYSVVNLGSVDLDKQADAANKVAEDIAQTVTEIYLDVARAVLKSGIGVGLGVPQILSDLTADAIEALSGTVIKAVGLAFEKIVGPIFEEIAELYGLLIGKPDCNGDVLQDTARFLPWQPDSEVWEEKIYTASGKTGCGAPAATHVFLMRARHIDVPGFASGPPPKVDASPALKQPLDAWLGTWAEDSKTPTPRIRCFIRRSPASRVARASNTLDVSINEIVDGRFGAQFTADAFRLTPQAVIPSPFTGNDFGEIRSAHYGFAHGNLTVRFAPAPQPGKAGGASPTKRKGSARKIATPPPAPVFKLSWQNQTANRVGFAASALGRGAGSGAGSSAEYADTLLLPEHGVKLTLYEVKHGDTRIAYWVRYQRDATILYTQADVMLTQWKPTL